MVLILGTPPWPRTTLQLLLNELILGAGYDAPHHDIIRLAFRAVERPSTADIVSEMEHLSLRVPVPSVGTTSEHDNDQDPNPDIGVEVPVEAAENEQAPAEAVENVAAGAEKPNRDEEQDNAREIAAAMFEGARQGRQDFLAEMFCCPLCQGLIFPQYKICNSCRNVAMCQRCVITINEICPFCLSLFGDWRNLMMEGVASTMRFSCYFHNDRCLALLRAMVWDEHLDDCDYNNLRTAFQR